MAYEILNNRLPASKYPLKATYAMTPQYITIHNTANDASAINEIAYMNRNTNATSYHVAIDDKHAVQAIPFSRNAWHCGDGQGNGNRKSIGIEICYSKSGGSRYYAAEENAIEYTAHVLKQFGWGVDRVKFHRNWSGKNCPHRIFTEGRGNSFLKAIADKLAELNGASNVKAPIAPKPDVSVSEVPPTPVPKEVDIMAQQLAKTQQDDMRALLKRAYDAKVFTVDHTPKAATMTRGEALDLLISYTARSK